MSIVEGVTLNKRVGNQKGIYIMKLRKTFNSPRVLQTCEVVLETNLLGASTDVQNSNVETTGHKVTTDTTHDSTDWTTVGSDFD